jgi:hypothetical protein
VVSPVSSLVRDERVCSFWALFPSENILKDKMYCSVIQVFADLTPIFASVLIATHFPRAAQGGAGGLWKSANEDFPDIGGRGIDALAPRPVFERLHGRALGLGSGDLRAVVCEFRIRVGMG